jgi:PGF-CTERM protein
MEKSNYVTSTVNDDGSVEEEIASGTTSTMASGQYFVVVQHPMYNGDFDVTVDASTDVVFVKGKAKGSTNVNNQFVIWGSGKLQGSDAATALINAINSPDIDDTYTKLTFLIEEPWIRINSIGDHYIGDQFKITGTTNLAIDDDLIVEVTSSSFQPTEKTQSGEFSGVSSTVKVTEGDSYNEWALDVDASTFKADEYIVNVEAIEADVTATTTFNVLKTAPTTAPTDKPTTAPTGKPTTVPTTPTPEPTASPGFGVLVALAGLGAVAALVMRKD